MPFTTVPHAGTNQYYEEVLAKGVLPLRMILIPAGPFQMGSPDDELGRFEREGPKHSVKVPRFFMGKYPVTQAQWRAVTEMPKVKRDLAPSPSNFKGDNLPVEKVSWYEAVEFCDRLTEHTGRSYRLPTEAQWEYACRAGTSTPFHFGDTITADLANYRATETYGDGPKGEYRQTPTPIDHFDNANAYGLCDMHGNMYEWCQDHWHDNYTDAPTDGSAWIEGGNDQRRVIRGGSWYGNPRNCRSAYRLINTPGSRRSNIGFRVSCVAPMVLA